MNIVNMIAGIVTAVGTLGLFGLGFYGLKGWRSQSNWKEEHDLAKRLLLSVYKLRDIIHAARNPFVDIGEVDDPTSKNWRESAYNKRWSRITAQQVELDAAMTEADVLWGKKTPLHEAELELRQQIVKLFLAIKHFLNNDNQNLRLFNKKDEEILYSTSIYNGGTLDVYDTQLNEIIGKYEAYLEQYLGRK